MYASEILNSSAVATDIVQVMNSSNFSEVLLNSKKYALNTSYLGKAREGILIWLALLSAVAQVCALILHARKIDRRRESWFAVTHVMFTDILVGYVPMLAQTTFEGVGTVFFGGTFTCEMVKYLRIYFLTVSTYMLVLLALNCYNLVVKTITVSPISFPKLYRIMYIFYSVSWVPSLIVFLLKKFLNAELSPGCIPYFFNTFEFSQYPKQISMAIFLLFVYIIPYLLILMLLSRVVYEIWSKDSLFYTKRQALLKFSKYDTRFVNMTFAMFGAFVLTNSPFVIQSVMIAFFDIVVYGTDVAVLIEILSVSNVFLNPLIYMGFEFRKACFNSLSCKTQNKSTDLNQNVFYQHCYEPVTGETSRGSFVKLINNAPQTETVKFLSVEDKKLNDQSHE